MWCTAATMDYKTHLNLLPWRSTANSSSRRFRHTPEKQIRGHKVKHNHLLLMRLLLVAPSLKNNSSRHVSIRSSLACVVTGNEVSFGHTDCYVVSSPASSFRSKWSRGHLEVYFSTWARSSQDTWSLLPFLSRGFRRAWGRSCWVSWSGLE